MDASDGIVTSAARAHPADQREPSKGEGGGVRPWRCRCFLPALWRLASEIQEGEGGREGRRGCSRSAAAASCLRWGE